MKKIFIYIMLIFCLIGGVFAIDYTITSTDWTLNQTEVSGSNVVLQNIFGNVIYTRPSGYDIDLSNDYYFEDGDVTANKFCYEIGQGTKVAEVIYGTKDIYYYYISGGWLTTSYSYNNYFYSITCSEVISNYASGTITKQFTASEDIQTLKKTDSYTLNGQTITPKIKYDGIEYSFTDDILILSILSGETFDVIYYLTGTTSTTPQLTGDVTIQTNPIWTNIEDYYNTSSVNIQVNSTSNANFSYDVGYYLSKIITNENQLDFESSHLQILNNEITIANTYDDGLVAYLPLTSDSLDYSGNSEHGTDYNEVTHTGTETEFDGVDDYISISGDSTAFGINDFTVSFWVKAPTNVDGVAISKNFGGWDNGFGFRGDNDAFKFWMGNDTNSKELSYYHTGICENWCYVTGIKSGIYQKLYINGILRMESTELQGTTNLDYSTIQIGTRGSQHLNGSIKDIRIYNKSLSSTEVSNLYEGTKNHYTSGEITQTINLSDYPNKDFCEVKASVNETLGDVNFYIDGVLKTPNSFFSYGGDDEITLKTELEKGTGSPSVSDVKLWCGSEPYYQERTTLCTDCNSTSFSLSSLTEGQHELTFFVDETQYDFTFENDYTTPVVTQTDTIQEGYKFNFYSTFDVTELNPGTCQYTTNGYTKECTESIYYPINDDYNIAYVVTDLAGNTKIGTGTLTINASYDFLEVNQFEINITDLCFNTSTCTFTDLNISFTEENESYTFESVGEKQWIRTYSNETIAENLTIYVNPYQYFYFYDNVRMLDINNFTFGDYNSSNYHVKIPYFDLGGGTHEKEFVKSGYNTQNINLTFEPTTMLNLTTNATPVEFILKAYDENSPTTQIKINVTVSDGINNEYYDNINTLQLYYNESLNGNISIKIESSGYASRKIFTELTPYSTVSQTVFLLNETESTSVIFHVMNPSQSENIEDVVFNFYYMITGEKSFLGQAKTDAQGYTFFNMDIAKDYEIIITKGGYISQTVNSIPAKSEYIILLEEDQVLDSWFFDQFSYIFSPNSYSIDTINFNASVIVVDESNLLSNSIFQVITDNNTYSTNTINSHGGTLTIPINENSTMYTLKLTVYRESKEYVFSKVILNSEKSSGEYSPDTIGEGMNEETNTTNKIILILFIYVACVGLGSIWAPSIGAIFGLIPVTAFGIMNWFSSNAITNSGVVIFVWLLTLGGLMYFNR